MLAPLRACASRASIFAAAPAFQRTWLSQTRFSSSSVGDILDNLAKVESAPPRAGSGGYPPPLRKRHEFDPFSVQTKRLRLHCHSSPNNTIATLTKEDGSTIAWFSGGSCGFKKGNRATYEAGYQCAVRLFKKIEEISSQEGPLVVDLFFKGFGQGRDALKGALLATEGEAIRPMIASITDRTPIKIGGTRAKKTARL